MVFPERFSNLPDYAFPRLRKLLDAHAPGGEVIHMSIGEPRHPFPEWVAAVIAENTEGFGRYPPNDGAPELLESISGWLRRRYAVNLDPHTRIMALNGTREGLFNACLALCPEKAGNGQKSAVLVPNPFYQVYAVAAAAAGAEPIFMPASAQTGFLPDYESLPPDVLDRVQIAYICSPSNPQGAVASWEYLAGLLALAERHDFRVFADECYSEIYRDAPPPGLLEVAEQTGADPERVFVFHSLSKRSNLPGLRSGFVAGGAGGISEIKRLRAYAGAPLPLPLQMAAQKLWSDENHVRENRALYREKYDLAEEIFASVPGFDAPDAGFFLWLPVEDGEAAALGLWKETGIRVLPGAYLSRDVGGQNPGHGFIRAAMVAPIRELQPGLERLRDYLYA